ncbi:hypothetical protein WA158_001397 [Blastocystis sp. Blastoise]
MQIKLFFTLFLITYAFAASSQVEVEGHRLAQFTINNNNYGSQQATLNLKLASIDSILAINEDTRVKGNRYVALAKFEELTRDKIVELVDIQSVGGIIIIVPKNTENLSKEVLIEMQNVEKYLVSRSFSSSIYFIYDEKDVDSIYQQIVNKNSFSNSFSALGDFRNNKKALVSSPYQTIQSMIYADVENHDNLPILVISANYDSFAVAPSLAMNTLDNASGTIGVLELNRLFSKLYQNTGKKGIYLFLFIFIIFYFICLLFILYIYTITYNILFVLTNGGMMDNEGLRQWLIQTNPELLNNILFALSLDRLGLHDSLHLHINKFPKEEDLQRLLSTFEVVGKQMNMPVTVDVKNVNLEHSHRTYMHERFAMRRIPSGTITSITEEEEQTQGDAYMRGSLFNNKVDMELYIKSIKVIAESLAKYMLNVESAGNIFEGPLTLNTDSITNWMNIFSKTSTYAPFITIDSPLIKALKQYLSSYADDVQVIKSTVDMKDNAQFFGDHSGTIQLYQYKSPFYDVYVNISLIIGCILFYGFIVYLTRGKKALQFEIHQVYESIFGSEKEN